MGAKQSRLPPELAEQCALPPKEATKLMKAIRKHANRKTKSVDRPSFLRVWMEIDPSLRSRPLFNDPEVLFQTLDVNHDGSLDLEEILLGLSTLSRGSLEQKAKLTFKAMDHDGNGALDREEVKQQFLKLYQVFSHCMMTKVSALVHEKTGRWLPVSALEPLMESGLKPLKDKLTGEGTDFIFKKGDTDGNSTLSLGEWLTVVKENEMAQWLVCPEDYINKVEETLTPQLAKLLESA